MAEVHVVIDLNANREDVPHWAIWTRDDDGDELIFEALGSEGAKFTFNCKPVSMYESSSPREAPHIGRIEADVWPDVPDLLKTVPMSNEPGWNCQNWVTQAIEALRKEGFLEEGERGTACVQSNFQKKIGTYKY